MTFTFRAADDRGWLAFASGAVLFVVEPRDAAFVASAWSAVREPDGFQRALGLLAANGLPAMPQFVLIEWLQGGTARVIVRGDLPVGLTTAAGTQQVSGAGVSTWLERSVESVESVSFEVPGAEAAHEFDLPLESGVVLAASISSSDASVPLESARKAEPAAAPTAPSRKAPASEGPAAKAPALAPVAPVAVPTTPAPATPEPAPAPTEAEPAIDDVLHDGETVMLDDIAKARGRGRTTDADAPAGADAPVTAETPTTAEAPAVDDVLHDGETVMLDDIAKARGRVPAPDADAPADVHAPASDDAPVIDDALHDGATVMLSDTARSRARSATPPVVAAAPPARPGIVLVVAPGGVRERVTQPILAGRSPSFSQVSGKEMPKLLTIGTADQDISRTHAQFVLEGDTLVVTDLHSRNGTTIQLPNKPAQKLRGGEPTAVIVGTVIDFGGGVTVTVEEES